MTSRTGLHNHHHAEELLEDYALGTLSADDAAWVRGHVETCAFCRAELGLLTSAAAALPFAPEEPPIAMSDDLWNRIEQAITQTPSEKTASPPVPVSIHSRRPTRQWLTIAALMVLSLLGGTILGQILPRIGREDAQGQQIAVQFTDPSITATGELRYLPDQQVFVLSVSDMPDPPAGHVYQAWLIDDGGPVPVGVMNPALGEFASAGNRAQFKTFAITVEPGPLGNATPTSEPVLVAQLGKNSGS